jgi:hypothetical protein
MFFIAISENEFAVCIINIADQWSEINRGFEAYDLLDDAQKLLSLDMARHIR